MSCVISDITTTAVVYLLLARHVPGWQHIKKRLDAMADGVYAEQG